MESVRSVEGELPQQTENKGWLHIAIAQIRQAVHCIFHHNTRPGAKDAHRQDYSLAVDTASCSLSDKQQNRQTGIAIYGEGDKTTTDHMANTS